MRGILTNDDTQIVFVDTPGLHRPKTSLGGRLNSAARAAFEDVDVFVAVIEAGASIGAGDKMVLTALLETCRKANGPRPIVVVNKIDRSAKATVAAQLMAVVSTLETLAAEHDRRDAFANLCRS